MPRFLVVTDTPGIKQFVFGTDPLAEVRGASALLDRLNRHETEAILLESLAAEGGRLERTVYANGGTGQFLVEAHGPESLLGALANLVRAYKKATGGEVRVVYGIAPFDGNDSYPMAARAAYEQLRTRREVESGHRAVALWPLIRECSSASHLPAQEVRTWGAERLLLSDASWRKRREIHQGRGRDRWAEWMERLQREGDWPAANDWGLLRSESTAELGRSSHRPGYIGLVYGDGNRMGRLVQEIDGVETCTAFSDIVDSSIREACYQTLSEVCGREIGRNRSALRAGAKPSPLPADILLLGGDDLIVLLPADRALPFVEEATRRFEDLTRGKIAGISDASVRRFFTDRVGDRGLTISCGVALARATYPFYLLLDLAEELLASAKRGGAADREGRSTTDPRARQGYWTPAYIDFHLVAGSSSQDLDQLRERDYHVKSAAPRTLRPFSVSALSRLRAQVGKLRGGRFPRSKIHDLFEASLEPSPVQSERRVREVFSRCKPEQRKALWEIVEELGQGHLIEFPWRKSEGRWDTTIADLAEAVDMFPGEDGP
jgi:hypothetical protein